MTMRFVTGRYAVAWVVALASMLVGNCRSQELTARQREQITAAEQHRISIIKSVIGSVISIYDHNRQGGGSGVIVDPSGIAITNHHVIMGAGVRGWGGLADGQLYEWELIGTDPGGDVALIQMKGRDDFPFANIGNSDLVNVGDWAIAMGNPFILTEDQVPTVTLGIVSGVQRYQPGAGLNELVYGNCIQIDSSINPGNSGGPLFNMDGEVIGINGRVSILDRGRVNVGLGYAISSNQIKNFFPDLLATKLVEHGTLDASFSDIEGQVVCSTINELAPVAKAGLQLGDILLEFDSTEITSANQFTNLVCTLPEQWPASLKVRKPDGSELNIAVRMFGLPYQRPSRPQQIPTPKNPQEKQQQDLQREMSDLLSAEPGTVRRPEVNAKYAQWVLERFAEHQETSPDAAPRIAVRIVDQVVRGDQSLGDAETIVTADGRIRVNWPDGDQTFVFDGEAFFRVERGQRRSMTLTDAKLCLPMIQAWGIASANCETARSIFGKIQLDGGDKSQARTAFRLKAVDTDDDWFYFWLSLFNKTNDHWNVSLLKASANRDGDADEGGVLFADWQNHGGWNIPLARSFAIHLDERITLELNNRAIEVLNDVNPSWFDVEGGHE